MADDAEDAVDGGDRLRAFYERGDEPARLQTGEGCVELVRTQRILRSVLEPARRILDVGGGDGVHAEWLVADGHDVEIVDLVPGHVERARSRGLVARVGDARGLPQEDARVDVVLLLGPLYHLVDGADRARALAEARRVLRPGGLLAAAAVSRLAVTLNDLRGGVLPPPHRRAQAASILAHGYDETADGVPLFAFHTVAQLREEVAAAGFAGVVVRGVEGPAWPLLDPACPPDDPLVDVVARCAEQSDADDSLTGASCHLLALAR